MPTFATLVSEPLLLLADSAIVGHLGTAQLAGLGIAANVFVLDGVLIGAGDGRYLALAGFLALLAYLPMALAVNGLGAGLVWLWAAYGGFMVARMVTLLVRARGDAWVRVGAEV